MEPIVFVLIAYFVFMNIAGYASMGLDKVKAKRHAWRIPEATLFSIAILGGSVGSIFGMFHFRHKTKHWYFVAGLPIIFFIQLAIAVYLTS
ncbi:MAG: DUF1294 domain-containing protein [Lachnospiraceae bacterium]|nr:DUF1294 domain-containing protein [Lachnospiraceae bacterium]